MTSKAFDKVVALLNHKRAVQQWVCRVTDGKIERMARIVTVWPADGAGVVQVGVTDWTQGEAVHHHGRAGGYGYDKRTAALAGARIGGVELGNWSDPKGRPDLQKLCHENGWELIGE